MQTLNSFTAIATFLDRSRIVRFDELGGIRIEGVTVSEARVLCLVLEALTQQEVADLATRKLDATKAPADPSAQRRPTPPTSSTPAEAPSAASAPPQQSEPAVAPNPEPAADPEPSEDAAHTSALPAQESAREPGADTTPPETPKARKSKPSHPTPDARPTVAKAPLRPGKQWSVGDRHEDVEVRKVLSLGEDGVQLERADGALVLLNGRNQEVGRSEGGAAISSTTTAAPESEPDTSMDREATSVPEEVMQDESARTVVRYLYDRGVTDKAALVRACVDLKEQGAVAFKRSRNEESIARRVNAALTTMGL